MPTVFEQLKKLWGRKPEKPPGDTAQLSAALPPIDLSQLQSVAETDAEVQELDAMYRQALAVMDAVEDGCDSVAGTWNSDPDETDSVKSEPATDQPVAMHAPDELPAQQTAGPDVTPHQILEAALFVGGIDLTLKKLGLLLNDEFPPDSIERFLEEIERKYAAENRPYEIAFGEGGYRLMLRSEFDGVRDRVFGLGPREIKLSQEALEVLSLVAYRQPISGEDVAALRGSQASCTLRQLIRRELITLARPDDGDHKHVVYRTSPRFLQAFGIASLEDLPQADDLAFK